jgi:hypothetical protein
VQDNEKFLEFHLQPKQSPAQIKICKLPHFSLTGHENVEPYKECQLKNDWGYLKNNRWLFNHSVTHKFGNISCKYRNLTRTNDFDIIYSLYALLTDNQPILAEVIEVICLADNNSLKYDALHVQIVDRFLDPKFKAKYERLKAPKTCQPMNIVLLSYDSLSRVSWFKRLPKTTRFILEEKGFKIMYGQSILGDGTRACMIPLLTGKLRNELPSALQSDPNGQFVDQAYPFIWNDLHKLGYMSYHMEDWPQISAFTYKLKGMSNRTAYHYLRAYQMSLWKRVSPAYFAKTDDFCIGTIKRHKKTLNLINEFIDTYRAKNKSRIAIMHYLENSHDGNEKAGHMDNDLYEFLSENTKNGRFENTVLFFYSDHGSRFSSERLTPQGSLEEKSPFFSVYLPKSFQEAYPEKYQNLVRNSQQITTAFDVYATLRELSCMDKVTEISKLKSLRSLSLLSQIPLNRSCADIGLSLHYCLCELDWIQLSLTDEIATKAGQFIIKYINDELISNVTEYCARLSLDKMFYMKMYTDKKINYYKVNLLTQPNAGNYEVLLTSKSNNFTSFSISSADSISRINSYGSQPNCLRKLPTTKELTTDLRKFCFCLNFKKP